MNNKLAADLIIPDIEEDKDLNLDSENSIPDIDIDDSTETSSGDLSEDTLAEKDTSSDVKDKLEKATEKIEDTQFKLEIEKKLKELRNEILVETQEQFKKLEKEMEDFKERKIPEIQEYEIDGAFRENLFSVACYVLDETLPVLFGEIPEYSLINNSISKAYSDGVVSDAIVTVNVSVRKNDYIHDFKIDVPILNGYAMTPQYMQRGLKIIPLTREAVQQELEYATYQKLDKADLMERPSIYTHPADNRYKRHDNQEQYSVINQGFDQISTPPQTVVPGVSKVEKSYGVNSPNYYRKY